MIKEGLLQTHKGFIYPIQKYGCLFLCYAHIQRLKEYNVKELNDLWEQAVKKGYITGDRNNDGDVDDDDESIMIDHNGVLQDIFQLPLEYDGIHHKANEEIGTNVVSCIGRFVWKYGHFVVINRRKEVTFDSLGYSNSVRFGKLQDMRFLYRV